MISTRNLTLLPDVSKLKAVFQSMAMLDAIIASDWWNRYYCFEADISPDKSISIGSMQNGSGDYLNAIFGRGGCLIHGFAHEYDMSPYAQDPPKVFPGILEDIPVDFEDCFTALDRAWWETVTFCVWRRHVDATWHHGNIDFPEGPDPDGSEYLLSAYDGCSETYHRWAERYYYPKKFNPATIRHVYEQRPLTEEVIRLLNPDRSMGILLPEIQQIGYPI